MRLKQIKLAGFKSFVDPTTVPFPDNLTAIVGPNGCGKSNLIDAVRWVMGESSAKNLRGDSMTDVIFNGSTARKPVGQASIELVFDNTDGTVTGEYASYNEIAVRRQVNREAQSTYYLNGTQCRRKDITNIFLGTGLGPRSYAIIEQGMISRLIESKPQELRIFIEEAAGISKYKERRRETENRIRHTRDNLDRLSDLREELGRQLSHLQRQAKAAERYKEYKGQERQIQAELTALRWQHYDHQIQNFETDINKLKVQLEAKHAEQSKIDAEIEISREKKNDLSESFNDAQGRFYGVAGEIARIEQEIKHNKERRVKLQEDLARLDQAERSALSHITADEARITEINKELEDLAPELESSEQAASQANEALTLAEDAMHDWQQDWDHFQQAYSESSQTVQVGQTRIEHSESLLERVKSRLGNLQAEQAEITLDPEESALQSLQSELEEAETYAAQVQAQAESHSEQISSKREQRDELQKQISELQQTIQTMQGREVKLNALQQAALGTDNELLETWLKEQGIEDVKLAQKINVEAGWEQAVETVLGSALQSIIVDDISSLSSAMASLNGCELSVVSKQVKQAAKGTDSIVSKITTDLQLPAWLDSVKTAENLDQALSQVANLKAGESIVTADGFWLGDGWCHVARLAESEDSFLARENELKEVTAALVKAQHEYQQLAEQLTDVRSALKDLETSWQSSQHQVTHATKTVADLSTKVGNLKAQMQHNQSRWAKLNEEIEQLKTQQTSETERLAKARNELEQAIDLMAEHNERKSELADARDEKRTHLEHCRRIAREHKETHHRVSLRVETLTAQLESSQTGKARAEHQLGEVGDRREELQLALADDNSPLERLNEELALTLEKRQDAEGALNEARAALDGVEQEIRTLDSKRQLAGQDVEAVRSKLEALKLEWQGIEVRRSTEKENYKHPELSITELLETLDSSATRDEWQEKLERVGMRIQRLGAINLAAIEEYNTQSERKIYLDEQNDDLCKALDTLENAIKKIDKETRTRFQETFETVNKGLQELFPKVFGGGNAYLELTGDDLLDTGVTVMARPPGKRNSTIHLLSGGEKALTAISLVFAIFQLKPAPFCMLDEVDAPLDDANVGRFCRLVEEMSKTVQFIYISHNKGAIEMAHHLAGVTMHEPGVSRMVSVDVDEATQLAQANG